MGQAKRGQPNQISAGPDGVNPTMPQLSGVSALLPAEYPPAVTELAKTLFAKMDPNNFSAQAPAVIAGVGDLFILEVVTRAWDNAQKNNRKTIEPDDVEAAVIGTDIFESLKDTAIVFARAGMFGPLNLDLDPSL